MSRGAAYVALLCLACNDPTPVAPVRDAARSDAIASLRDAAAEGGIADDALPESSPELQARAKHLLEAISGSNGDLASDILFPRDGWVSVRDQQDPGAHWDNKVKSVFDAQIKRIATRMKGIERAQFVSLEIGHTVTKITPRKKDFKRPLWRVKRSVLSFMIDGKLQRIEIADMVAWKGNWYLVRLRP